MTTDSKERFKTSDLIMNIAPLKRGRQEQRREAVQHKVNERLNEWPLDLCGSF